MKFRYKEKVRVKKCIAKKCLNTLYGITVKHLKAFPTNDDLTSTKRGMLAWQVSVDDFVKLLCDLELKSEFFG